MVDSLSEAELSDLAQLYVNATTDQGLQPKLIQVMAHRLDTQRLGRVSKHFGFGIVYAAVTALAPAKTQDFLTSSNPNHMGPTPGEARFGPWGRYSPARSANTSWASNFRSTTGIGFINTDYAVPNTAWRSNLHKVQQGLGQFLNMTPYEIYLSFRTAPVGALDVTGAIFETAVASSKLLILAYGTGYGIGTFAILPLIETYAPNLYIGIGDTIGDLVQMLTTGWSNGIAAEGKAQQSTAPSFTPSSGQLSSFQSSGGDYAVTQDWSTERLEGAGGYCTDTVCQAPY